MAARKTQPLRPRRYTGGCLCGAVRFEAMGPALKPHSCSCLMCQRHSGAQTLNWVEFPRDQVLWTGSSGMPALYRSSDFSRRAFCQACGSTIGAVDDAPVIALVLGAFDPPLRPELAPTRHSFAGKRPKWWRVTIAPAPSGTPTSQEQDRP
jgi:hypothetical protein